MIITQEDEVRDADGRSGADDRGGGSPRGGHRQAILLVEDADADRDVYGGLLWYNGFDVIHAGDGETAVARALELHPDLILLDIGLPGPMNGLDVARRLRESGLESPVIFLSAHSRDEFDAAQLGSAPYLEKPIDPFTVMKEVVRRIGYAQSEGI